MGWYGEHVLPRIVQAACGMKTVQPLRRRVCEGLAGDVVEIGFGPGHNVAFYPAAVTSVAAVEPSDVAWKLAGKRVAQSSVPVRRSGLDGQSLPFADASFDAALSTWTLCTIPDVAAALSELRRVLKPGGLAVVTVPFVFRYHADPVDYQRFSPDTSHGLRRCGRGRRGGCCTIVRHLPPRMWSLGPG